MSDLKQITDRLFQEGTMCHYKACPVCGHPERVDVKRRPYYDRYILGLAKELDVYIEDVTELFQTFECTKCDSLYLDPWLTAKGMNSLYGRGHSQHILGWYDFYSWVQEQEGETSTRKNRLWDLLQKYAGDVKVYGQLNFPFSGLLMHFRDQELKDKNKKDYVADKILSLQKSYLHPFKENSLANRLMRLSVKLRSRYNKMVMVNDQVNVGNINVMPKGALNNALGFAKHQSQTNGAQSTAQPVTLPEKRYLIFETTPCFWTTNCVSMNCTCHALSSAALNTPVIDFKDVDREKIQFDVFGLFNCLDHFVYPKEILKRAVERSRIVFFDVHKSEKEHVFSRQHLYVFGKNFVEHICEQGWQYLDITEEAGIRGQNAYLVSNKGAIQ